MACGAGTLFLGISGALTYLLPHEQPAAGGSMMMIICLTLAFLVAFFFLPEIFTLKTLNFQSMLILVVFGLLAWPVLSLFSRLNNKLRDEVAKLLAKRKVV